MEFLLAILIKVFETIVLTITKVMTEKFLRQREKTTLTPHKRKKGGSKRNKK